MQGFFYYKSIIIIILLWRFSPLGDQKNGVAKQRCLFFFLGWGGGGGGGGAQRGPILGHPPIRILPFGYTVIKTLTIGGKVAGGGHS